MSEAADITACDREPIHLSGAIQPFGCLIAINKSNSTVEHVSKNVSEFLKIDAISLLGMRQEECCRALECVSNRHVQTIASGQFSVLEVEVISEADYGSAELLLSEIALLSGARSLADLIQGVADAAQRLTGFERVMIYKFSSDWSGTVIAETIAGSMSSFLDLRFPATDIPMQARRLYSQKLLRYIPDVNAAPVAIDSLGQLPVIDLSDSELRSVSPVHIEYLRNMAVGASMSLSLMVEGKLWGLVACHNPVPLNVHPLRRQHCKFLAQFFSRLLTVQEQALIEKSRADAKVVQIALLDELSRHDDFVDALSANSSLLLQLVHATGAGLKVGNQYFQFGDAPSLEQAKLVMDGLDFFDTYFYSTDQLPADFDSDFKGVVAAKLSGQEEIWILWVRPEVVSEVSWAGEPVKLVDSLDLDRLHPRRSFAIWKETVSGRSNPWNEEEISSAKAFTQYLRLKIERDRSERERERLTAAVRDSNQKLGQFVDTISHDLRSPLISIGNLAQWIELDLGATLSGSARENLDILQRRVAKLRAQLNELLEYSKAGNIRAEETLVDVDAMIRWIIEPYKQTHEVVWQIDELPVFKTVKAPLEHVFSNLIDNAVKYSNRPGGCIRIGYSDAGSFYRFFVSDQGKGIPLEYLEEIFLPLRSLSGADSESHGMGLAFVKRIVEQAGGDVSVRSAPNAGACFEFSWKKVWNGIN